MKFFSQKKNDQTEENSPKKTTSTAIENEDI